MTRIPAPQNSPGGRVDGVPNKGKGNVNAQIDRGTANVTQREETTAEDCFSRLRLATLNPKFINTYTRGTNGAPSQSFANAPELIKHPAPSWNKWAAAGMKCLSNWKEQEVKGTQREPELRTQRYSRQRCPQCPPRGAWQNP